MFVLLDEAVLRRPVGSAEVTRGQLLLLADLGARPTISIQVVPFSAGAHIGLLGAFVIAELADAGVIVFLENVGTARPSRTVTRYSRSWRASMPSGGGIAGGGIAGPDHESS
jgi:hypothetical protein